MNQNIKNIVGGAVVVALLTLGYAAMSYVNSYGKSIQPSSFRSFSVTGDGKITAKPDVAEFSFQVVTEGDKDVASLQSKNTDAMNKVIAFVKSNNVDEKDIKTDYYNINPRYQTYSCNQPQLSVTPCPPASIVGYTITQSVTVKVRDFTKIGNIMSGIVANGANQVGALSFTIDDPTKLQDEARADAITKAKTQAEAIAEAGGFRLGRLLNIQDAGYRYPTYDVYSMKSTIAGGVNAPSVAPTIQSGSQDVTASMTLQYEIQ